MIKKRYHHHNTIFNTLVIGSSTILLLLGLVLLNPNMTIADTTHATTGAYCKGDNGYVACDATSEINAYARIAPVVSIGMQSDVVMDIVPKSSGVTIEQPVRLTVSTNSSEGYSLYMKTVSPTNAMTSTTGTSSEIKPVVVGTEVEGGDGAGETGIEGEKVGVDINTLSSQGNVWGYSIGEVEEGGNEGETNTNLYQPVPMNQDKPIRKTSNLAETSTTDTLDLTFGLHVDTSLPSGTYTNKVLVSAVANPVTITSLDELVFMQDMTSSICENTPFDTNGTTNPTSADLMNPVTKQLIDTRDGKKYWVAKLADGNCWMTQNLALDLSTDKTLTSSDTDVIADWTPVYSTRINDATDTGVTFSPAFNLDNKFNTDNAYSWGMWQDIVDIAPTTARACKQLNSDEDLAACDLFEVYNAGNQAHDTHYLVGNYYQYSAATADTGNLVSIDGTNATSSICPKGWMPPTAGSSSYNTTGSFAYLWRQYGLATADNVGSLTGVGVDGREYNIATEPLYFTRSGLIYLHQGQAYSVGNFSYAWSRTAQSSVNAYHADIRSSSAYPSWGGGRQSGMPVRCLAR